MNGVERRKSGNAGGYSLLELVVTLGVVSILLVIVAQLHLEYIRFDRTSTAEMFRHPLLGAVTARMRQDVISADSYPGSYREWSQSPTTLILKLDGEPSRHVVWELSGSSVVRRQFTQGNETGRWMARGLPSFEVSAETLAEGRRPATRLRAVGEEGRLVYDGIFQPRAR